MPAANTVYEFQFAAVLGNDAQGPWSASVPAGTGPVAPGDFDAQWDGSEDVLTWTAPAGAGPTFYYDTADPPTANSTTATSATVTQGSAGTIYYLCGTSPNGDTGDITSATSAPYPVPTAPVLTAVANMQNDGSLILTFTQGTSIPTITGNNVTVAGGASANNPYHSRLAVDDPGERPADHGKLWNDMQCQSHGGQRCWREQPAAIRSTCSSPGQCRWPPS